MAEFARLVRFELHRLAASRLGSILFVAYWLACALIAFDAAFAEPREGMPMQWAEAWRILTMRPALLGMVVVLALVAVWQGEDQSLGVRRQVVALGYSRLRLVAAKPVACLVALLGLCLGQVLIGVAMLALGPSDVVGPPSLASGLVLIGKLVLELLCFSSIAFAAAAVTRSATAALLSTFAYTFLLEPLLSMVLLRVELRAWVAYLPVRLFGMILQGDEVRVSSTAAIRTASQPAEFVGILVACTLMILAVAMMYRADIRPAST